MHLAVWGLPRCSWQSGAAHGQQALTSAAKADALSDLGPDRVVTHGEDLMTVLGVESIDLFVDNFAGGGFPTMLNPLCRGGR